MKNIKKYGIALLYHFENLRFFAFFNAKIAFFAFCCPVRYRTAEPTPRFDGFDELVLHKAIKNNPSTRLIQYKNSFFFQLCVLSRVLFNLFLDLDHLD